MKGSCTAPADFFDPRAKLFYSDVLFGNSVLIRRAICCSLVDFLTMYDGPFISTDIILLFVCTFFICCSFPVVNDYTLSGKMVHYRSTNLALMMICHTL